ncbi:TetR/AcrR family transcriptional regulator [Streptomyces synnematoformans]|uniref:HTH tetR-type domain-containing protein n=1 Tax=Streptomyces synnematoformans TaxID=415721 RepID=A0ABN2XMJ6_9ACTN
MNGTDKGLRDMTAAPRDAGRADARRNRAKALAAASQAFDEHGPDISLGVIARRVGVGAGTVYRHFPGREILLEAVLVWRIGALVVAARGWSVRSGRVEGLFGFLLGLSRPGGGARARGRR